MRWRSCAAGVSRPEEAATARLIALASRLLLLCTPRVAAFEYTGPWVAALECAGHGGWSVRVRPDWKGRSPVGQ